MIKIMKKASLLFILLISSIPTIAQVPGYMGRRFDIGVDFMPSINVGPFGDDWFNRSQALRFINFSGSFRVDYARKRNKLIGLSYNVLRINTNPSAEFYDFSNQASYNVSGKLSYTTHRVAIRLGKKFANDDVPLPIGSHIGMYYAANITNVVDVNGTIPRENGFAEKGKYLTVVTPDIGLFWGTKRAIAERLLFYTSAELSYVGFFGYLYTSSNFYSTEESPYKATRDAAIINSFSSNLVSFRVGLSFTL